MARKPAGPGANRLRPSTCSRSGRAGRAAGLLAWAGPARGNGALPASFGILLPADRPQQVVLATNFGMIISEDAGTSWRWTCEQPEISFGYLYGVGPPPRDRFYGLSPEQGLAISDDGSCSWQRAGRRARRAGRQRLLRRSRQRRPGPGGRGGHRPTTAATSARPRCSNRPTAGTTFGATPLYAAPAGANIVSVEIARSNPMVVYMAMYTTPSRHPRLLRSANGGQTLDGTRRRGGGIGANEFRILTVDPDDADVLYLRVVALGVESVAVTRDAGMTFATPIDHSRRRR